MRLCGTAVQAKKWAQLNRKKWAAKKQHNHSEAQKEELAPEVVRKIVKVCTYHPHDPLTCRLSLVSVRGASRNASAKGSL